VPQARNATHLLKTGNPILHSPALFPSFWPKRLNALDADVGHGLANIIQLEGLDDRGNEFHSMVLPGC
jgi:hypothetical protein